MNRLACSSIWPQYSATHGRVLEGFQATVTAIKANEAVVSGQKLAFSVNGMI